MSIDQALTDPVAACVRLIEPEKQQRVAPRQRQQRVAPRQRQQRVTRRQLDFESPGHTARRRCARRRALRSGRIARGSRRNFWRNARSTARDGADARQPVVAAALGAHGTRHFSAYKAKLKSRGQATARIEFDSGQWYQVEQQQRDDNVEGDHDNAHHHEHLWQKGMRNVKGSRAGVPDCAESESACGIRLLGLAPRAAAYRRRAAHKDDAHPTCNGM